MAKKLKVAFLVFPDEFFKNGELVKSGSIIINEQVIKYLRANNVDVTEFAPKNLDRLALRKLTGIGNALMYQDLLNNIEAINECDAVITANYFGSIIPEIKKPLITIFHHSAKTLLGFLDHEDKIIDFPNHLLWKNRAQKYGLAHPTEESVHNKVVAVLEQYLIENSQCVVAVSKNLKEELTDKYSADPKKITVAHNSIPPEWEKISINKNFDSKPLNLTCITRMPGSAGGFMMKGADRIFEIFLKSNDRLYQKKLVASTNAEEYREMIHDYLPKVEYVENASHDQVKEILTDSHVTIHCSRVESFGLTLIESMLLKNVVITYPVGVASEIIENGKNGFIVNNKTEMLKVINNLPKRNDLSNIAENAQLTVKEKLSPSQFGKNYLKMITDITSK